MKGPILCAVIAGTLLMAATQVRAASCVCSNQFCSLDAQQSALYLDCILTAQGAKLPTSFDFSAISALDQLSVERQADMLTTCDGVTEHKLPALNGLNDFAIGTLQEEALSQFARAQFPSLRPGKAIGQALIAFTTMTGAQCKETATSFSP